MQYKLETIAEYKAKFYFPIDILRIYLGVWANKIAQQSSLWDFDGRFLYASHLKNRIHEPFTTVFDERVLLSYTKIRWSGPFIKALARVPFVEAIFLSGSVASLNAKPKDDIDILLFVRPRRLWLTRFLDLVLLGKLSVRRFKHCLDCTNKLCMNFYKSVNCLRFRKHNIAFATQFVEAIPLYIKEPQLWSKLVKANSWVRRFYPDWWEINKRLILPYPLWFSSLITSASIARIPVWYKILLRVLKFLDRILPWSLNILDFVLGGIQLIKARARISIAHVFRAAEITTWENKLRVYNCEHDGPSSSFKKGN